MRTPRKAFVLAAGFGTRMLPLTRDLPKPLMPVWNVPAIEHVLAMLKRWGVRDVLVNLHHRADLMLNHFRQRVGGNALHLGILNEVDPLALKRVASNMHDELRIQLSFEPEILGTGGALRRAEWFFAGDEPVWVLNADVVMDLDPGPLLSAFRPGRTMASAWLHADKGPRTVEARRGFITNFRSRRAAAPGTFTFCGLQLVDPRLLDRSGAYLPKEACFCSIIDAYERAMRDGWKIAGVCVENSFWADVGTPQQYLAAHRELLEAKRAGRPGARLVSTAVLEARDRLALRSPAGEGGRSRPQKTGGFSAVSPSAVVHRSAHVVDSVVWDGAVIAEDARITGAVIGRDARVAGNVNYLALPAIQAFDEPEFAALRAHGWDPAQCTALPLGPRGSARTFTRVRRKGRDLMLVRYDASRLENTLYAGHTRFLRRVGVPVPQVLLDRPGDCVSLFTDLGDRSLEAWMPGRSAREIRALYRRILDKVLVLHERGVKAARREHLRLVPSFRPVLYRWERNYFAEHMLKKRMKRPAAEIARIKRELAGVARHLQRAPRVLVHRDLQSSNILLHGGRPWFIDYQGMRYGPAVYDLASLLCDPYVDIPDAVREELIEYYASRCSTPRQVRELFWYGVIQRLAQALGAYARLGTNPDTRYFARYIPPALRMVQRALEHLPGLPALRAWAAGAL